MKKRVVLGLSIAFLIIFITTVSAAPVLLKIESNSASEAFIALGNFLFKNNATQLAQDAYERSIELQDNEIARHNLGLIYLELGKNAESEFLKALEINPDYAKAHNSLGLYYFHQDELEKAASHFRSLVELEPDNEQAHFDLGVSIANIVRNGNGKITDLEEALVHFNMAAGLNPENVHAQTNAQVMQAILAEQ